jgi:hypothetical protein
MKATIYMRVAKTANGRKPRVAAATKSNPRPLTGSGRPGDFLPTVFFAVDISVPDVMFKQAERVVADLALSEVTAEIAATLTEVDR